MKYLSSLIALSSILSFSMFGNSTVAPDELAIELPEDLETKRHPQTLSITEAEQIEHYVQGLVDAKYMSHHITVKVRNGQILLSNLPQDTIRANKIILFVKKFSALPTVNENELIAVADPLPKDMLITKETPTGIWLPQSTVLFPTQVANPRQISFSVGPRFNDICGGNYGTAFTFGDQCPIYRWANFKQSHGDLQLELEAGAFAVFSHDTKDFPMQNADYYAGIPLTYAKGPWAFRIRGYHISSHLGDEYIQHNGCKDRKNRSFEAIDFFTAYKKDDTFVFYGGPGIVVHSDPQMRIEPFYLEYGMEARGEKTYFTQLYARPFAAIHVRNDQEHRMRFDATVAAGYEWGKIQGLGRKIRCFVEYHDGFSPDGQFTKKRTNYFGIRLSYGF